MERFVYSGFHVKIPSWHWILRERGIAECKAKCARLTSSRTAVELPQAAFLHHMRAILLSRTHVPRTQRVKCLGVPYPPTREVRQWQSQHKTRPQSTPQRSRWVGCKCVSKCMHYKQNHYSSSSSSSMAPTVPSCSISWMYCMHAALSRGSLIIGARL